MPLLALALAVAVATEPAGASTGDEAAGLAVASFTALHTDDSTAAILTGVAESLALEHVGGGRFVAHGELARHVDRSPDRGCRTDDCLTRAAAALGATHLLTGEVGRLGDGLVLRVKLLASGDGTIVASVSRDCRDCNDSALPAMLETALREALGSLGAVGPQVADQGRTVFLRAQRPGGAFRHEDVSRTVVQQTVVAADVELSALTRPDDRLSCVDSGTTLQWQTTIQAVNTAAEARSIEGVVVTEVFAGESDKALSRRRYPVSFELGAATADEVGFDQDGAWLPLTSVGREVLTHALTAGSTEALRVRVSWGDELLEEQQTRPLTRFVDVDDLYLVHDGQRTSAMPWGQRVEVHLVLTKRPADSPAEVTLRLERQIRFWFDTDNVQASYEIASGDEGSFHLVLPFVPGTARQDSSEGVVFEVWVNGCMLMRSQVYQ